MLAAYHALSSRSFPAWLIAVSLLGALSLPSHAQSSEPAELAVHPQTVAVRVQNLQRNGAGIR